MVFSPIPAASLGDNVEGGYLICKSGGVGWIVSPFSTEVERNWYNRNDAITCANAQAACGDWFIPNCAQILQPGAKCKQYWDGYSDRWHRYWSNTEIHSGYAWFLAVYWVDQLPPGHQSTAPQRACKTAQTHIAARAFRCATY